MAQSFDPTAFGGAGVDLAERVRRRQAERTDRSNDIIVMLLVHKLGGSVTLTVDDFNAFGSGAWLSTIDASDDNETITITVEEAMPDA